MAILLTIVSPHHVRKKMKTIVSKENIKNKKKKK